MISLKDQIGHLIELDRAPKRIVSLVPSQTELLHDLGLGSSVVGVTKFCIHPRNWKKSKSIIGGTKNVHHDKIASLKPDLIIANKEENTKEDIKKLQEYYPVYTSDIFTIPESFVMMNDLGLIFNKQEEVSSLIKAIEHSFKTIRKSENKTVAYLIWQNPIMLAGKRTFIQSMLELGGFKNILASTESRYPEVSLEQLKKLNPDYLLLSSEPFPFKPKHKSELEKRTGIPSILVDGEMFSWYGSRMLKLSNYLDNLTLRQ